MLLAKQSYVLRCLNHVAWTFLWHIFYLYFSFVLVLTIFCIHLYVRRQPHYHVAYYVTLDK